MMVRDDLFLPRVGVVVLNYNGLRWLKDCLSSLSQSHYRNLQVYVVDNGSSDGSADYVRATHPNVKIIKYPSNYGFARAYNMAIHEIDTDYVMLLNNDTIVLNQLWLDKLVNDAETDAAIAAVGCKLVSMDNHETLDSVGSTGIKYWRGFVDIGKHEPDRGQYDDPPIVPFALCGAAMLVRKSAFEKVHGFDERFHSYVEDVDLCWRWRLMNYRILYEPSSLVAHYFSGTAGAKTPTAETLYLSNRNLLRSILKNCGDSLKWALRAYFLFAAFLLCGYSILEPAKAKAILRSVIWNLFNFKETYTRRLLIQSTRIASEPEILRKMYVNVPRQEPNEREVFRRILNTLFERSKPLNGDWT